MSNYSHWLLRFVPLGVLGAWFTLSVINQVALVRAIAKARRFKVFRWDVFGLIPFWAFWSTDPTWDAVLLYRDKLVDGQLTPWKCAWSVAPEFLSWIWSPQVRKWKAMDAWLGLLVDIADGKRPASDFFLTRIYVSTALYVSGLHASSLCELRQFMVARVCGCGASDPTEILFVSPFFPLEVTP